MIEAKCGIIKQKVKKENLMFVKIRKQHNNERTHFCNECGKGFFKVTNLNNYH